MIAGMARGGYGFDPAEPRSAAPKAIVDAIEELGLRIDKDTVLTHLRSAFRDLEIDLTSS